MDFGFKPKMKALQEFDLPDDLASALPNIVKDQAWEGESRHFACTVVWLAAARGAASADGGALLLGLAPR